MVDGQHMWMGASEDVTALRLVAPVARRSPDSLESQLPTYPYLPCTTKLGVVIMIRKDALQPHIVVVWSSFSVPLLCLQQA